ncbi:cilium assembly protein DZIP1 isoform X1 [Hylaeus volcanicus]|uniref:cilium assembly protein DZIP1 isoform X1 n=1 Tax=Hylaeus volcanicus TaxID=313075 RepID=UPI0023B797FC|nr:cilium assembly protein DZIP1 isoform X1 [Hylaeus volcanicus]
MAFSFRIGTKWCHDFPKLARDSGFYFNTHKSRVRVDWNRISNIDIDRIIRDRDFHAIDDNINSVIDYSLESEYDVKILDSNFVKLFRLAQLAVEYLLYCKEYLDHSVVILKDELRLKIEDNVKLKKETATLEEVVKNLKDKAKDRSKLIETKIGDCNGEIYKCPHCPKTFISPMFVSAHILRRHAYASDLCMTSSPIHEHYRSETERLHNEIKNLKERLNETERVIRNESESVTNKKMVDYEKKLPEKEIKSCKHDINKSEEYQEYKEYQEEIKNLKTILFDEIHNLRQKEKMMQERTSEANVQTLMNQQEKEFIKLKNQLFEQLTPDIESMNAKLHAQENYWKSKIELLENQHQKDVERLTAELKVTQKAADDIKSEYESKVSDLERQTFNQSQILIEQSKKLHSLSNEMNVSQLNERNTNSENNLQKRRDQSVTLNQTNESGKNSNKNDLKEKDRDNGKVEEVITRNMDSTLEFPLKLQNKLSRSVDTLHSENIPVMYEDKIISKHKSTKRMKNSKFENKRIAKKDLKNFSSNDLLESKDSVPMERIGYEKKYTKYDSYDPLIVKSDLNKTGTNEVENTKLRNLSQKYLSNTNSSKKSKTLEDDVTSDTSSESDSNSQTQSESESITVIDNKSPVRSHKQKSSISTNSKKTIEHNSFHERLQSNLQNTFEQKLRDLGIDPEWQGIPNATFKQKIDILKHHQKITMKKLPKYHQIKSKIIEEVLNKISRKGKATKTIKQKHLSLNKLISNSKLSATKAFSDKRDPGNYLMCYLTNKRIFVNKMMFFPDNSVSTSQLLNIIPSKLHSTPQIDHSVKNMNESELSPIKSTIITSYKDIESLIKLSPNSIKSVESTWHSQGTYTRKDSLNKMRVLLDSEEDKVITNSRGVLDVKSIENNNAGNSHVQSELQNISISPKYNKSVLKSASGSTSSLTKKKVFFDLANEKNEKSLSEYDSEKEELYDSNWNISRTSDEKKHLSERESYKSTSNIMLKTVQSDKIAEISKKLEAQLSMVRRKPVGSIETMFSLKYVQDRENHSNDNQRMSSTNIASLLESPVRTSTFSPKVVNDSLPQAAPRNLKNKIPESSHSDSISEISDLDSDIDKILRLE